MITLYHATNEDYIESVEMFGLEANSSDKPSLDQKLDGEYVFGFNNIRDAITFGLDNYNHYAIFSFEIDEEETIVDTEYDGEALAIGRDITASELTLVGVDLGY